MKDKLNGMDTKKLLYLVGSLLVIIIIIVILSLVGNSMFSKNDYTEIENTLKKAAKEYYSDNKEELPQEIGDTESIDDTTLSNEKYMKDLQKYVKKDQTCSGVVNVTNVNNTYRYTAILDCGEDYITKTFKEYIDESVEFAEEGEAGLYTAGEDYIYRGDNVNNYIKVGSNTYRIIRILNDGSVKIILDKKITSMNWDNRYNVDKKNNSGINKYKLSRVNEYLTELFEGEKLLSNENKLLITSYDLAIGSVKKTENDSDGLIEQNTILASQYIGLPLLSDFLMASLDENCTLATSASCTNYNYLVDKNYTYWTATADGDTSYKVYKIDTSQGLLLANANSKSAIKPVIYLAKDILYVSGDGTSTNPYIVK